MNKKFTSEDLFRRKLSEAPIPDWKGGWESLLTTLDGVDEKSHSRKIIWIKRFGIAAIILLFIGLGSYKFLTKPVVKSISKITGTIAELPGLPPTIQTASEKQSTKNLITKKPLVKLVSYQSLTTDKNLSDKIKEKQHQIYIANTGRSNNRLQSLPPINHLIHLPAVLPQKRIASLAGNDENLSVKNVFHVAKKTPKPTIASTKPANTKSLHKIHFAVRLNANGASSFGHEAANFSPVLKGSPVDIYPSVYVSKYISPKFSLQAGLAVVSPVNVQQEDLNRSVSNPLRAMTANVPQSADSVNLSRLYYADMPLTIKYHFSKKLSIGSGFQISVLEKVIGKKQRLDYNRYGMVAMEMPEQPQPENLTHKAPASGAINPVDFRWVVGLQYQFGKHWNASLQYQYGLTDISSNRAFLNDHVNRNNVLRAGIGFVIE